MNIWALYLGMAAALCMVCSLFGAGLMDMWGMDPSRETPGAHRRGAGLRLAAGQFFCFAAILPACLWLSAEMGQVLGRMNGALMCAGYAILCAMMGLLAMFTSVRHGGGGIAFVCGEEFFAGAKKMRCALGCVACVFAAGAMLMSLLRDGWVYVSNFQLYLLSAAVWPMLSMQLSADSLAPVIRNERQILPSAAWSAVCAALIGILMLLPGKTIAMSWTLFRVLKIGIALTWLISWVVLFRLGARGLYCLTLHPLKRRKRGAWLETLLCAAASISLALYGGAWVFAAASALCALAALMDFMACAMWIHRIGRGFFS